MIGEYVSVATRGTQTLVWNSERRLTSVSSGGSTVENYVYDGDGTRVKKTVNGIAGMD